MRLRPLRSPLIRLDGRWWHRDEVAVPPGPPDAFGMAQPPVREAQPIDGLPDASRPDVIEE